MRKNLIVLFVLSLTLSLRAQDDFWKSVNENRIILTGKRQIVPQKYLTFELNQNTLKNNLQKAPNEKIVSLNQSSSIIWLPLPDGTFQRFKVVNSPVMEDALAKSFPDIQTFSVKGIDDALAYGKLDWNEFGFHAMIRTPNGDFFIDPYCLGNTLDYISYFVKDFVKPIQDIIPESNFEDYKNNSEQKKPAPTSSHDGNLRPANSCVGANLRTYRLAVACTGQYAQAATGFSAPTVAQTLAKIVTSVNRVDGVYETEVAIRMVLVATETLVIFTDPNHQPFTGNNNANTLISESQTVITATIGSANFDIGHTFSTGGGGLAYQGCVCNASNKARGITGSANPVGDPYDIDYVAHEMGHEFGASHTFNCGTGSCAGNRNPATAVEPGSGVTLMAYAGICGAIDNLSNHSIAYFHTISYDEIINYTNNGYGNTCPVTTTTGNHPPVVGALASITVPKSTPFFLTGQASDPDGDSLTYSWEEIDIGAYQSSWNKGIAPYFRSYVPSKNTTRFFPMTSVVNSGNYKGTIGEYLPDIMQTLNFRFVARDNKPGGGGVCYSPVTVAIDTSGPMQITNPTLPGVTWYVPTHTTYIFWDVNGTDQSPVSCDSVQILISMNGGNTYSVMVNSTPNVGALVVNIPQVSSTISTCRIKILSRGNNFYSVSKNNFTIDTSSAPVGLARLAHSNGFGLSLSPNPFQGEINFSAVNLQNGNVTNAEVMNVFGMVVAEKKYFNKSFIKDSFELSGLPAGIYFFRLSNGGNYAVNKIVKQ